MAAAEVGISEPSGKASPPASFMESSGGSTRVRGGATLGWLVQGSSRSPERLARGPPPDDLRRPGSVYSSWIWPSMTPCATATRARLWLRA